MKRLLLLLVLASGFGIALPRNAVASRAIVGRVTDYNATSVSVRDKEVVTVTLDGPTTYTKRITHKPWQEDPRLTARAQSVGAQSTSSAVLNSLEVRELIKRAQPADHTRLDMHFAVLAEQHAAEAQRHSAMAQAFIASPIRRTAANVSPVRRTGVEHAVTS